MKLRFLIALAVLLSAAAPLLAGPFSDFLKSFDYPEIMASFTAVETAEMDRITQGPQGQEYPDKIIRLYLVASEINTEPELGSYLEKFQKLADTARNNKNSGLNEYNRAEYLLGYLHDAILKTIMTGSGAGYNIGIRETLDKNLFNCYKSALVYNGLLEYFGYQASYVQVPNHIYSVVTIGGLAVDVETTNRYGFDPYDKGLPAYSRAFDAPGVKFNKKSYSGKKLLNRLSVLSQVFHNRASLYSGSAYYSEFKVNKDLARAMALSLMGDFLNTAKEAWCFTNTLNTLLKFTQETLDADPMALDRESRRFTAVLALDDYAKHAAPTRRNWEILCVNALAKVRQNTITGQDKDVPAKAVAACITECLGVRKYVVKNAEVKAVGFNNSLVFIYNLLEKRYTPDTLDNVKSIYNSMAPLFAHPELSQEKEIMKQKGMVNKMLCMRINNIAVDFMNRQEWGKAKIVIAKGIPFAVETMGVDENDKVIKLLAKYREELKNMK